jgi:ferric-dicitrate binding protein FerR (iron transport regulator)
MDERAQELICRVVDGCATARERQELKAMQEQDPEITRELEAQGQAVDVLQSVGLRELQDDVAEQYWGHVYNRLERRVGWVLAVVGTTLVAAYGVYELLTAPDIHTVYRVGLAAVIVGFGLILSSVLRVRLKLKKQDEYQEVIR